MTRTNGYDPTKASLFKPGDADDFFKDNRPASHPALCAEMSRLAYCKDEDRVKRILSNIGFGPPQIYKEKGTHALLTKGGNVTVLAFRGTESDDPYDISDDLNIELKKWRTVAGRVHAGFATALDNVWKKIEHDLDDLRDEEVLFTGHSLGAAIASLAAGLHPPAGLYTFGSPRVGDQAFCDAMAGKPFHRYVNCCDFVTRVPPSPYKHFGKLHYIDSRRRILEEPEPKPDSMTKDQQPARIAYFKGEGLKFGNVLVRDLADHAPINYVLPLMEAT